VYLHTAPRLYTVLSGRNARAHAGYHAARQGDDAPGAGILAATARVARGRGVAGGNGQRAARVGLHIALRAGLTPGTTAGRLAPHRYGFRTSYPRSRDRVVRGSPHATPLRHRIGKQPAVATVYHARIRRELWQLISSLANRW